MAAAPLMLDTNTVSAIARRRPRSSLERLESASAARLLVSAITEAELRFGLARRPDATRLAAGVEAILANLEVRPFDARAASAYGRLRAVLEGSGTPLGDLDTLIAAHALAEDAILVTSDRAFGRVAGLRVEDWA